MKGDNMSLEEIVDIENMEFTVEVTTDTYYATSNTQPMIMISDTCEPGGHPSRDWEKFAKEYNLKWSYTKVPR